MLATTLAFTASLQGAIHAAWAPLWLAALGPQGPTNGSPFTSASLPFEELKAPPDSAFDVLMTSLAMLLLSVLCVGVFLGLSKLGTMAEAQQKEAARARAEAESRDEALLAALGTLESRLGGQDGFAPDPLSRAELAERIEDAIARSGHSLGEALSRAGSRSEAGFDPSIEPPWVERLIQAVRSAGGPAALGARGAVDLAGGAADLTAGLTADPTADPSPGPPSTPAERHYSMAAVLERVMARLAALGFESVSVVSPPELDGDGQLRAGQLIVEAKRAGATHKGRVFIVDGGPGEIDLRPSHSIFP